MGRLYHGGREGGKDVPAKAGVRLSLPHQVMAGLDPAIFFHAADARVSVPSPLWGGTSERSEDRVGSLRRLHPTPAPPHKGEGNYLRALRKSAHLYLCRSLHVLASEVEGRGAARPPC